MSTTSDDCVFCRIVAGEIPAEVLARNDHAIAIRDLHPQAPFHVLVVPVEHHENAAASAAADPAVIGRLVSLADEVARASGNDDYRLVANTGAGAGQTVFHTHLHVLGGTSRLSESLV
ncbi:HIT domain-containing protein [Nocardioides sp. zg-1228]|uniref:HIT domain-containing protein n=1 Tax=Nocardioides sp. zg-1228 TaxID=2763008 RepID=UPI001642DFEB|nr:HIT domain-containing protein [Nocardioides sp. zg-1228]MBC2934182.1 HIT domain-containing protein [Nocardioides sp. zg-1228]QSF58927.1 HIT domain-containing protein [Nocardioides sp. zg-1228]